MAGDAKNKSYFCKVFNPRKIQFSFELKEKGENLFVADNNGCEHLFVQI